MARRPRPTHLRALEGVVESRLNRGEPTPDRGTAVSPPVKLSAGAVKVWDRLAPDLVGEGVLTHWDVDLFVAFCETTATYHAARAKLGRALVVDGSTGSPVKNPLWRVLLDCEQTMTRLAARFGLTPADRAGLKIQPDFRRATLGPERLIT